MAYYLLQVSYTPEAWATLVRNPQNRLELVRPAVERLGGSMDNAWLAFGEYDVVIITQFPDNVSAASFAMAGLAGGALKACKTTPLMTTEEGLQAMKKAGGSGYRPPGS